MGVDVTCVARLARRQPPSSDTTLPAKSDSCVMKDTELKDPYLFMALPANSDSEALDTACEQRQ